MISDQEDEGEVVAIGTGDACILNNHLTTDGRVVMDCHAAAIARKALMKYDAATCSELFDFACH